MYVTSHSSTNIAPRSVERSATADHGTARGPRVGFRCRTSPPVQTVGGGSATRASSKSAKENLALTRDASRMFATIDIALTPMRAGSNARGSASAQQHGQSHCPSAFCAGRRRPASSCADNLAFES